MKPHDERPIVYIAAPYTVPDCISNTHDAIMAAEKIEATGLLTSYVPHMNMLWHLVQPHDVDFWYSYDLAFLARSDALYRLPGDSVGADDEAIYAGKRLIPVFYAFDPLIEWAKEYE